MGLFPLHGWLPDAYTQAPAPPPPSGAGGHQGGSVRARADAALRAAAGRPPGGHHARVDRRGGDRRGRRPGRAAGRRPSAPRVLERQPDGLHRARASGLARPPGACRRVPAHPDARPHERRALRRARRGRVRRPETDPRRSAPRASHAGDRGLRPGRRAVDGRGAAHGGVLLEVVPPAGRAVRGPADPGGRDPGREPAGRGVHVPADGGGVVRRGREQRARRWRRRCRCWSVSSSSPWLLWRSGCATPPWFRASSDRRPRGRGSMPGIGPARPRAPAVGAGGGPHRALAPPPGRCARPGACWPRSPRRRSWPR